MFNSKSVTTKLHDALFLVREVLLENQVEDIRTYNNQWCG